MVSFIVHLSSRNRDLNRTDFVLSRLARARYTVPDVWEEGSIVNPRGSDQFCVISSKKSAAFVTHACHSYSPERFDVLCEKVLVPKAMRSPRNRGVLRRQRPKAATAAALW